LSGGVGLVDALVIVAVGDEHHHRDAGNEKKPQGKESDPPPRRLPTLHGQYNLPCHESMDPARFEIFVAAGFVNAPPS
jgi:hypothetical protein